MNNYIHSIGAISDASNTIKEDKAREYHNHKVLFTISPMKLFWHCLSICNLQGRGVASLTPTHDSPRQKL